MKNKFIKSLGILSLFATAMAFMESSVVIYLREIYYPSGFEFPLKPIHAHIGLTEVVREAATLIILLSVSYLTGSNLIQRFAYFLWSFALWDIGYYLFLWLIIGWPQSLFTWDVLFLIPLTWTGPVIAPVALSILMIGLGYALLYFDANGRGRLNRREWILLTTGSLISIISFMYEHIIVLAEGTNVGQFTMDMFSEYAIVPERFAWPLFITGAFFILSGIVHFIYRQVKMQKLIKKGQLL